MMSSHVSGDREKTMSDATLTLQGRTESEDTSCSFVSAGRLFEFVYESKGCACLPPNTLWPRLLSSSPFPLQGQ